LRCLFICVRMPSSITLLLRLDVCAYVVSIL
jgi:hypothetical protein